MKIQMTNPTEKQLYHFHKQQRFASYTYTAIGASAGDFPKAYKHDRNRVLLGEGALVFHQACELIKKWKMFPPDWTQIYPLCLPIEKGQEVVVLFQLMGLWWYNSCRIVYTINEENRFGFAYGTLQGHVEQGEECFEVYRDENNQVWYQISAFSRPNVWLTKVAYPLARYFQKKFVRQSREMMLKAIEDEEI
ncbi:MAG: DUF1990 domain-containing protein [Chitinophagales bacterium]|nr:DUF1990 domain-containing protein [Chitinophagales bacterium]